MKEVICIYKEEQYTVRDNGEVLRHPRPGKSARKHDGIWTFGKLCQNGYLEIASVRVHRIVATAFHGLPPSDTHVVDHIDTNKQNNRPENLRWVTRLENALLNPITARRIAIVCGSVEAFLANPSAFRDKFPEPNFNWMGQVSPEEAKISLARLLGWAQSNRPVSGGSLGQWIFNRTDVDQVPLEVDDLIVSTTPNAAQRNWKTPSEFPCCPQIANEEPILLYADTLRTGTTFCSNEYNSYKVHKLGVSGGHDVICIIAEPQENAVKPWALAKITHEEGLFVHTALGTFFSELGAEKKFCVELGYEPPIGDCMDDYC